MKWNKKYNLTTKIAYIAGFIDGEGCIRIKRCNKKGNSYYVTVTISGKDKSVFEMMQGGFGGKIYLKDKRRYYQYYLASGEAVDFLKCILSYLRIKASEASLAILFYDCYPTLLPETKAHYYVRMKELKHNIYENKELLEVQ